MINKKWKVVVSCFSAAVMFSNFHVNATDFEVPLAGLGARVQEILKETGTESATVRTTALMVRKEASQESAVLTIAGAYEKLGVIENGQHWVKVAINDVEGYVAKDYIELVCQYQEAESIKVVNERLSAVKNALASAQDMLADATQAMYEIRPGDAAYDAEMAHQAAAEAKALAKETAEQPETEPETAGTDQSAVPALSTGTTGIRQDVVNFALQFVGNPYVYGGTDLYNGTDCSGFTQSVMLNFGYTLPRTAGEQSVNGQEISQDELQPGDLLFYSGDADYGIDHVTMYIGGGQVVHASSPSNGIMISNIDYRTPYSARRYIN